MQNKKISVKPEAHYTRQPDLYDEQILAAIIAGAKASGRAVGPAFSHDGVSGHLNGFGVGPLRSASGPVCAVGAGVLYAGIPASDSQDACAAFAKHYGCSEGYAAAVSYGFETTHGNDYSETDKEYLRGFAVGQAAFEALCLPEEKAVKSHTTTITRKIRSSNRSSRSPSAGGIAH